AVGDGLRFLVFDRRQPRSGAGAFTLLLLWLFGMGHESRDFALMAVRMYQFLTSCRERRLTEYEKMSFWDFMQADRASPKLQRNLGRYTRLLSAMDAHLADARTVTMVLARMAMDQGSSGGNGDQLDRVLNAATTERWILPWISHLRNRLGVRFHWNAPLTHFVVRDGQVVDAHVAAAGAAAGTVSVCEHPPEEGTARSPIEKEAARA